MENKVKIVNFGKYKGEPITSVPRNYADWQRANGNKKFYCDWMDNNRFNNRTQFDSCYSKDGHFLERKLNDGNFVFKYSYDMKQFYYLVDSNGKFLRDLESFGSSSVKQGAIDTTEQNWITLTPSGNKLRGKMIVSPYYEHFVYDTYQIN